MHGASMHGGSCMLVLGGVVMQGGGALTTNQNRQALRCTASIQELKVISRDSQRHFLGAHLSPRTIQKLSVEAGGYAQE